MINQAANYIIRITIMTATYKNLEELLPEEWKHFIDQEIHNTNDFDAGDEVTIALSPASAVKDAIIYAVDEDPESYDFDKDEYDQIISMLDECDKKGILINTIFS